MVLYLTLRENYHENGRWQWHFSDLQGRQDSGNQTQELQKAPTKGKASSAGIRQCMSSSSLITNVTLLFTDQNDPLKLLKWRHWIFSAGLEEINLALKALKPQGFFLFSSYPERAKLCSSSWKKNFSTRSKENKRKQWLEGECYLFPEPFPAGRSKWLWHPGWSQSVWQVSGPEKEGEEKVPPNGVFS